MRTVRPTELYAGEERLGLQYISLQNRLLESPAYCLA